jgi:hypothetical protein
MTSASFLILYEKVDQTIPCQPNMPRTHLAIRQPEFLRPRSIFLVPGDKKLS